MQRHREVPVDATQGFLETPLAVRLSQAFGVVAAVRQFLGVVDEPVEHHRDVAERPGDAGRGHSVTDGPDALRTGRPDPLQHGGGVAARHVPCDPRHYFTACTIHMCCR